MSEIDNRLGDRLRTLVACEEPSTALRSEIQERLRQPPPRRSTVHHLEGVYFAPGYEAEALDVARLLGLGVSAVNRTPPPVPEPNGADVLVVIGTDLVATSAGLPLPGPLSAR